MKLTLPLNYTAFYKKPRMSGWSQHTMQTQFTGIIRDVDRSDVQIAFRIGETRLEQSLPQNFAETKNTPEQKARHNEPFRCTENPLDVIHFEGAFYAQRFPADQAMAEFSAPAIGKDSWAMVGSSPLYGAAKFSHPERDMSESQRFGWYEKEAPTTKAEVEASLGVAEVKRWTPLETDAIKLAEQVFDTFIIVDGMVYEKVGEPVLKVVDTGGDIKLVIDELKPLPRLNSKAPRGEPSTNLRYGIDQIEEAREAGRLLAKATGRKFVEFVKFGDTNPAFVTFRGEPENLYNYAVSAYIHFTASDGHGMGGHSNYAFDHLGREAALAVYDFARAIEANESLTPEIVRASRVLAALYKSASGKWEVYNKEAFPNYGYEAAEQLYRKFEEIARGLEQRLQLYDHKADSRLDWNKQALDATPFFSETDRCYEISSLIKARKMAKSLQIDADDYAVRAADGRGRLLAIEDYTTKKILAGAYFPQDGSHSPKIWVPSHSQRRHEFEVMFTGFLTNANQSVKEFDDELDSLGL
jgi:hypothetical protein